MKRCPDCGYRVKDDLRLCPLCGVRMHYDRDGKTVQKQLHKHTQRGETCMLTNKTESDVRDRVQYQKVQTKQKSVTEKPKPMGGVSARGRSNTSSSTIIYVLVLIVLSALMKSCAG